MRIPKSAKKVTNISTDCLIKIPAQTRTAADLKIGEKAIIKDVDNDHPSSHRILEVGFTPGQEIELVNKSLFNDPIALSIRGTIVAIRRNEAICIKI